MKKISFRKDLILAFIVLIQGSVEVKGFFEFCTSSGIYRVTQQECPFGVLFRDPQDVDRCYYPTAAEPVSNACTDERDAANTNKIHYIDTGINDEEGPSSEAYAAESCKDPGGDDSDPDSKCEGEYIDITQGNTLGVLDEGNISAAEFPDPYDDNTTNADNRLSFDVRNQTFRLFLFMNELLLDENDNIPQMRLVLLLRKSFEVLRRHCSTQYVSLEFSKEVEKAFLFLLRESDLEHVKDISVHEFTKINAVLDKCLKGSPPHPFYLLGDVCRGSTKVKSIIKTWESGKSTRGVNKTHPIHLDNDFAFKWGKYDVPVDATWSVMDFTHGMCYGTFRDDMNSHHLYEQALQRLFTPELMYRWSKPARLHTEYFWNHVLRSYTDTSMKNVDACIQASYLGSPYLHRLSRPMVKQVKGDTPPARRKRQATDVQAYCLQNQADKDIAFKNIKDTCP